LAHWLAKLPPGQRLAQPLLGQAPQQSRAVLRQAVPELV
jgi:hypothetical protein